MTKAMFFGNFILSFLSVIFLITTETVSAQRTATQASPHKKEPIPCGEPNYDKNYYELEFNQKEIFDPKGVKSYPETTLVKYNCKRGNKIFKQDNWSRICQNGSWTENPPKCECSTPSFSKEDGYRVNYTQWEIIPPDKKLKQLVTVYECLTPHHEMVGSSRSVCVDPINNTWSTKPPKCVPRCSGAALPKIDPKKMQIKINKTTVTKLLESYSIKTRVNYICAENYHNLTRSSPFVCMENGDWRNGTLAKCVPTCLVPVYDNQTVLEGHFNTTAVNNRTTNRPQRYVRGTSVTYQCIDKNDLMTRNSPRMCLLNGSWSGQEPKCEKTCPPDFLSFDTNVMKPSFNASENQYGRYRIGTLAEFKCINDHYDFNGTSSPFLCRNNGSWNQGKQPTCVKTCNGPLIEKGNNKRRVMTATFSPSNFQVSNGRYFINTTVTYSCQNNYQMMGTQRLKCLPSGIWDHDVPYCEVTCGEPEADGTDTSQRFKIIGTFHPEVLQVPRGRYSINTTVTYRCAGNDLHLNGSQTLICHPSGDWNGRMPTCVESSSSNSTTLLYSLVSTLIVLVLALGIGFYFYCRKHKNNKRRAVSSTEKDTEELSSFPVYSHPSAPKPKNDPVIYQNIISIQINSETIYTQVETGLETKRGDGSNESDALYENVRPQRGTSGIEDSSRPPTIIYAQIQTGRTATPIYATVDKNSKKLAMPD